MDGSDGGREGVKKGLLGVGSRLGEGDEGDGEAVVGDEELGELSDGDEMAHAGSWQDGYVR